MKFSKKKFTFKAVKRIWLKSSFLRSFYGFFREPDSWESIKSSFDVDRGYVVHLVKKIVYYFQPLFQTLKSDFSFIFVLFNCFCWLLL